MKEKSEVITGRQNPLLVWAGSLAEKKYRDRERSFLLEGKKLVEEAAKAGVLLTHVFLEESKKEQFMPLLAEWLNDVKYTETMIVTVSDAAFTKISQERAPQGIIGIAKYLDKNKNIIIIDKVDNFTKTVGKCLMLYSVRDPSNLGAIIRSAVAFGKTDLILTEDCADLYNPKTVRAAMGGLFRIGIHTVAFPEETVRALQKAGRRVFAAELSDRAVSLDDAGITPEDVVVIGNEGHGMPASFTALCDQSVFLPIAPMTESLNAAVAASIFLWEQRN